MTTGNSTGPAGGNGVGTAAEGGAAVAVELSAKGFMFVREGITRERTAYYSSRLASWAWRPLHAWSSFSLAAPFMWSLIRPMLPMVVILAVPIVPFVLFGSAIEAWLKPWEEHPPAPIWIAVAVVGLLSTDIFLPVPSSVVSTLAGPQLGILGGTAASWLGMTLGAVGGFALARQFGPAFARWFSRSEDLQRASDLRERFGPAILAIGRGVPVVAEATVLWMGIHQLPWRKFLPPVLLSNLVLAFAYSVLGTAADQVAGLPLMLALAIAVPVVLAYLLKWWSTPRQATTSPPNDMMN